MYKLTTTTSDGMVYTTERDTEVAAKRIQGVFIRTGYSDAEVSYTPAHTVKVSIEECK